MKCIKVIVTSIKPDPKKGAAYAEGWYACKNNISQEENPYKEYKLGTSYDIYRMDWNSGWSDCNDWAEAAILKAVRGQDPCQFDSDPIH